MYIHTHSIYIYTRTYIIYYTLNTGEQTWGKVPTKTTTAFYFFTFSLSLSLSLAPSPLSLLTIPLPLFLFRNILSSLHNLFADFCSSSSSPPLSRTLTTRNLPPCRCSRVFIRPTLCFGYVYTHAYTHTHTQTRIYIMCARTLAPPSKGLLLGRRARCTCASYKRVSPIFAPRFRVSASGSPYRSQTSSPKTMMKSYIICLTRTHARTYTIRAHTVYARLYKAAY